MKQYGSYDREVRPDNAAKPTSQEVDDFHTNSDVNLRAESQHHTLGPAPTQASPGNHRHDGGDSEKLLTGYAITGARNSDDWRISINRILVAMGADDQST